MNLSVVVPTLNGRDQLVECLDALHEHASTAEVIVVNGPSTDGTTGMVRNRDDIATLIEISDRTINVARNAGLAAATGDVIALVSQNSAIEADWEEAVSDALSQGADVVTGPVHRNVRAGVTTESPERHVVAGHHVNYFDGGNVAFTQETVEALDGFDEYLRTGGARDAAHRLASQGRTVEWSPKMSVLRCSTEDSSRGGKDWGWKHRALAYRLVKNYGFRPTILAASARHAVTDALSAARNVLSGDVVPSRWIGQGRNVLTNIGVGYKDGLIARARDRTPTRNPNGMSRRADRAVELYDWR